MMYDEHHLDETGKPTPIGVIRLVPPPHPTHKDEPEGSSQEIDHDEPYVKLTRVALLAAYRGKGLGRVLIETALNWAVEHRQKIVKLLDTGKQWTGLSMIHAQVDVEAMYARVGFVTDKSMGRWMEEGIEHVGMWKRVSLN